MIIVVTPDNRARYAAQVDEYHRIRKAIFHDRLAWDVSVEGDREIDIYDRMPCTYVLSVDEEGTVQGGLRQMPTTGPTLTWEKFSDLVDDPTRIFAPNTWETTRFAVRPERKDFRLSSGVNRIAVQLSAASLRRGLDCGARRHVAVCEERVVRLTHLFGIPCETLGRRAMPGGEDILCVAWEVSDASLARLAWAEERLAAA